MKYLISLLLLLAAPASAQEQVRSFISDQYCSSYQSIIEEANNFGETILFNGSVIQQHISQQYSTSPFVFFVNQNSGTWTLVSIFPEGWACHVAGGTGFEPFAD